jgi:hypothetical protein
MPSSHHHGASVRKCLLQVAITSPGLAVQGRVGAVDSNASGVVSVVHIVSNRLQPPQAS